MPEASKLSYALFNAEQSRDLDNVAINEFGYVGISLMKMAGERAFSNMMQSFSDVEPLVVLCGPGNNGGDGYVVANCALSIGLEVLVVQSSKPKTKDAVAMCRDYLNNGGKIADSEVVRNASVIVDALLGTGIKSAPLGTMAELISLANSSERPILALDLPSGLDSDNGFAYEPCINAAITVTFIGQKFGMYTGAGREYCGTIRYEDLNLPREVYGHVKPSAELISQPKFEIRNRDSHKGNYGNVVLIGGDKGMLGATLLAGRAALRAGAGLVTVLSQKNNLDLPALNQPELMSQCFEFTSRSESLLAQCDVIVLGPGLGESEWSEKAFQKVMAFEKLMVVDADGLNWLAKFPQKRGNWILTPHPAEAARLLSCTTRDVQRDRRQAITEIVIRYGGVCVLKGAGTLVADNSDKIWVCDCGNPGMSTAGMGDVLSGIAGALLGQNHTVIEAAKMATWIHSYSADRAAACVGEISLLAGDVIDALAETIQLLYKIEPGRS